MVDLNLIEVRPKTPGLLSSVFFGCLWTPEIPSIDGSNRSYGGI